MTSSFSTESECQEHQGAIEAGRSSVRNLLLVAGESGIIKVLDLQRGRIVGYLRGHTGAVHGLKAREGLSSE